jgi:hypothetical protein
MAAPCVFSTIRMTIYITVHEGISEQMIEEGTLHQNQ